MDTVDQAIRQIVSAMRTLQGEGVEVTALVEDGTGNVTQVAFWSGDRMIGYAEMIKGQWEQVHCT